MAGAVAARSAPTGPERAAAGKGSAPQVNLNPAIAATSSVAGSDGGADPQPIASEATATSARRPGRASGRVRDVIGAALSEPSWKVVKSDTAARLRCAPRATSAHASSRCSRARIARLLGGFGVVPAAEWSAPWVTRRRSSSAADQRTSPVWPPRPAAACSAARSTETTMSPRCGRCPGGAANAGATAGRRPTTEARRERNDLGGRSGNDRTSVGPSRAEMRRVELGQLGVVGRGSARSRPATARRPRPGRPRWLGPARRPRTSGSTPSRIVEVDPPGREVDRALASRAGAGPRPRRDSSSTTLFCG